MFKLKGDSMRIKFFLPVLIIASILFIILGTAEVAAHAIEPQTENRILYSKPGASGTTCSSWVKACELQTALSNSTAGDQIWLAAGTYKPTTGTDRSATFELKSGVAIYGGFPEAGGTWEERDWQLHNTTLSGDIGVHNNNDDNSYCVVTGVGVDETAILDGFTISGGNGTDGGGMANFESRPTLINVTFIGNMATSGAGIYNYESSPVLTNVTLSGNSATYGGGMYNDTSNPSLTSVVFSSNSAPWGCGGGMYNDNSHPNLTDVTFSDNSAYLSGGMHNTSSNPTLTDVTFSDNSAYYAGGGMYNTLSSPSLTNVTFMSNTAVSYGGGMYNEENSNPLLANVTFEGNSADGGYGAGMYNHDSDPSLSEVVFADNLAYSGAGIYNSGSNPALSNIVFIGNSATYGSGMYNLYSGPTLIGITLSGNSASFDGGGMYNEYSSPTLTNVTFSGNSANFGGGMYNTSSSPVLTHTTFSGNLANEGNAGGAGMYNYGGNTTILNSIFWGNSPDQISGPATVTYSDVKGGWTGDGNINDNPYLGALAENGGFSQTHALITNSPAIDNGNPETCPNVDQRGYARPVDGDGDGSAGCDMGAFEYGSHPVSFTLSVEVVGGGSVTQNPEKDDYLFGEVVTLAATANNGWSFAGWSGDFTAMDHTITITIRRDMNITATFSQKEYALTVQSTGSGSVSVEPLQSTYHLGDKVTLTPTANPGWTFAGWGSDAVGTEIPLIVVIEGDTNITAIFTLDEYTLSVSIQGSGLVTIDPKTDTYHHGNQITLTPVANLGWTFVGWSGDATGADVPLTVTIQGDTNITATFTQNEYTLTMTLVGSGSVAVFPKQATYHYGDEVTLIPTADANWTFTGWGDDASGTDNPLTITIQGNTSLTAIFTQDRYALTLTSVGSGSISVNPVKAFYQLGDQVTLTAKANPGWVFSGWGKDATGTGNPLIITIQGNTSIEASFTSGEFVLVTTIEPDASGFVTIEPGQDSYHYGDVVTLAATPATSSWWFSDWSGDITGTGNPLIITIQGNTSITATFTQFFRIYLPSVLRN